MKLYYSAGDLSLPDNPTSFAVRHSQYYALFSVALNACIQDDMYICIFFNKSYKLIIMYIPTCLVSNIRDQSNEYFLSGVLVISTGWCSLSVVRFLSVIL